VTEEEHPLSITLPSASKIVRQVSSSPTLWQFFEAGVSPSHPSSAQDKQLNLVVGKTSPLHKSSLQTTHSFPSSKVPQFVTSPIALLQSRTFSP
jgi:hypothetical protein